MTELKYICDLSTGYRVGLVEPEFKTRRAQVRWRVRHLNLSGLDLETRRDASQDPRIEWDASIRQYRMRRAKRAETASASAGQRYPSTNGSNVTHPPPLATDNDVEGRGPPKGFRATSARPALATSLQSMTNFPGNLHDD